MIRDDLKAGRLPVPKTVEILLGDAQHLLDDLAPASVQSCVTSPPFWGLRDYGHDEQFGAESSPQQYVDDLVHLFRKVRRALSDDGTLWLNIGDGYARNGGVGRHGPNAQVANTKKDIQKRNLRVPSTWGLKDRDLMGIPWRVAFALQEDGWILRSRITWVKRAPMPESVKNRPSNATEDVFLFAKSAHYYYDNSGFREESGANLRNYWILGPDTTSGGHPAAFPRELAKRCILLGSRPGDIILDPFAGSGTTGVAAAELDRSAILMEINPDYVELAQSRLETSTLARLVRSG